MKIRVSFLAVLPAVACLLTCGAAGADGIPMPYRSLTPPRAVQSNRLPATKPVPLSDFFGGASTDSATWSADGKAILYTSNQGGQMNVWRQSIAGGKPTPVSRSDLREGSVAVTPDGKWVVFQGDRGGRIVDNLYEVPASGGEATPLAPNPSVTQTGAVISMDGTLVAFTERARAQPCSNVAVMSWKDRKVRLLTHEAKSGVQWEVVAIAANDRFLIANRYDYSFTFGQVYRIDIATGRMRRLTSPTAFAMASDLSPDGRSVALYLNDSRGVKQAALLDLPSGKMKRLAPGPWDQETSSFSPDGHTLLFVVDTDGIQSVFTYDVPAGIVTRLPIPPGVNSWLIYLITLPKYSPDGRHILVLHSSSTEPFEYWIYDTATKSLQRVTHFWHLDARPLPKAQLVHYRSFDGTVISAFLYVPFNLERHGSAPAVVVPHGGPTAQMVDYFEPIRESLASQGYVVLSPNFRGSTGYGKAFLDADHEDLGRGDVRDLVAGAHFLVQTGYVDAHKIGIAGGSYGGFLTLMALGRAPTVWAAGVDMFGPINWLTMWNAGVPQDQRYIEWLLGDPVKNRSIYVACSPLTYLSSVRAPLLVLQGQEDPIVPAEESRQVIESLERRGAVVSSHFYPGEGHGLSRLADEKDELQRVVSWLDRYVKDRPQEDAPPR